MTATNHVLAGSLLVFAAYDSVPLVLLLPAAFLLHFGLDAAPHFGLPDVKNPARALSNLRWILPIDCTVAASVLLLIFMLQPQHWFLIALGGVLCSSPDLFHIPMFVRFLRTGNPNPYKDWFSRFHGKIQWCERPWGIYIEVVFFLTAITALIQNMN